MNKTMTIAVIALVAVVMGMSSVAPVMAEPQSDKGCPRGFVEKSTLDGAGNSIPELEAQDRNDNDQVCVKEVCPAHTPRCTDPRVIIIDDNVPKRCEIECL